MRIRVRAFVSPVPQTDLEQHVMLFSLQHCVGHVGVVLSGFRRRVPCFGVQSCLLVRHSPRKRP